MYLIAVNNNNVTATSDIYTLVELGVIIFKEIDNKLSCTKHVVSRYITK